MKVRIVGATKEKLQENIKKVLDVTTTIIRNSLPTAYDIENRESHGRWWFLKEDTFEILSISNDHKFFIKEEGDNHIDLQFHCRYDIDDTKKNSIYNVLKEFFHFIELVE